MVGRLSTSDGAGGGNSHQRRNRVRSIDDASRQADRNRSRRCKRDGPLSKTRPECDRNHESRQDRRLPADRKSATESHKSSCAQPPRSRARASRPIKHWNRCHGAVRRYRSVRRAVRAAIRGRTTHARCLLGDRCGSGYPQPMRRVGESSCSRAGRITAEPSLRRYPQIRKQSVGGSQTSSFGPTLLAENSSFCRRNLWRTAFARAREIDTVIEPDLAVFDDLASFNSARLPDSRPVSICARKRWRRGKGRVIRRRRARVGKLLYEHQLFGCASGPGDVHHTPDWNPSDHRNHDRYRGEHQGGTRRVIGMHRFLSLVPVGAISAQIDHVRHLPTAAHCKVPCKSLSKLFVVQAPLAHPPSRRLRKIQPSLFLKNFTLAVKLTTMLCLFWSREKLAVAGDRKKEFHFAFGFRERID